METFTLKPMTRLHFRLPALACSTALLAAPTARSQDVEIVSWVPGTRLAVPAESDAAPQAGCRFGFSMAMSDRYAVIGAPDVRLSFTDPDTEETTTFNGAGAAFVFELNDATGEWTFLQRLVGPEVALMQTGCSVGIDSETEDIVLGAWGYSRNQAFAGAAFVYRKGKDGWGASSEELGFGEETRVPSQVLAPVTLSAIDQFGFSVAINRGTIAVGCPLFGDSNTGAVFMFERREDGSYRQDQRLVPEDAGANDQAGTKVAVSGDLLVVGVQNDDVQGRINAGSAIVYTRPKEGDDWSAATRLNATNVAASGGYGSSVACFDAGTSKWIAVGSPTASSGAATNVAGNGLAFVYASSNGGATWTLDGTLLPRSDNVNNNFGYSIGMSDTEPPQVMVGAPGYETAVASATEDGVVFTQIVNAGAGFAFTRGLGGAWAIRSSGPVSGDLWTPAALTSNSSIGRSIATAPTLPLFALVGADTPTGALGTVFPFEYKLATVGQEPGDVAGPAPGPLGPDGRPGGDDEPTDGSGGTGGGITGGGSPTTGITAGPGAIETPLAPVSYEWGLIKASAVAMEGRRIFLLQTDGKHTDVRPEFRFFTTLPAGASFVGLGDLNGDLSGDVVWVDAAGTLKFWKRDEFTIVQTRTVDSLPDGYEAVLVADTDGNRKEEVFLRSTDDPRQLTVWTIEAGAISASADYELPEGDWDLSIASFTARNAEDLMLRERSTGALRLMLVDGDEVSYPSLGGRGGAMRLSGVGDANGDGQPDLVWQGRTVEIDYMGQDDDGAFVRLATKRAGFANKSILDVRDWNDDGTIDFWCQEGRRNFVMYGKVTEGYMYSEVCRDIGNAPGRVIGFAAR